MDKNIIRKRKWQGSLIFFAVILISYASSVVTNFDLIDGVATLPAAFQWIVSNLMITADAFEKLPGIMDKLIETIFMSIAATTIAALVSIFLGCMGSKTTRTNGALSVFARFIASASRNIPVVAWALILLISFGQNSMTGFLALFVGTVGFLTRAFIEAIDEADQSAFEALQASGATYFQIVSKAVLPQCLPQMISWTLFMVETNIRSATLVGILTGTGIGYTFDLYYKMLDYEAVALITMTIVIAVIMIELASNQIRKVIL
ncbi:phosphonate ABC transporter permease [Alkalihalobacillus alcalophilus ATCC 27647 = CGMCC 1.3604]|uniref:Phosphonate ABC transporter permease n=1 Tax=Alkalihalobacillus alcalophilus ATCC 27647 = CGMCC 1.3604 TaxID=1218173 RepID=J8TQC1_ALKAL|nr:phosphonate ABC transporter, permease protein PhnE [Alkalihalobacillus alcalophilus]AFV25822.1 phosphonate transporter [Alkalihalobacillus alcalophilus ATCC 27647 = CGMCC 1.3604]KGA99028.1 phosphonate ABC transporter permease [Alkalihalobacillus alcalophilus ATCC 27647 = CGMCC 1.3604]MED1560671.1 phosphonate ABC transporter, permease protein PhnE [Alkalihalobacillus alcalophilus]THG89831.1 phosphonate ABC transporter permease [Alkalihalobacillus alcalophilus ATCC 27647 = CGMCC 1.3604]